MRSSIYLNYSFLTFHEGMHLLWTGKSSATTQAVTSLASIGNPWICPHYIYHSQIYFCSLFSLARTLAHK